MKKTLSLLLASTMILGMFAGCSSDDGGTSSGGSTSTDSGSTTTPDSGTSTPDTTPTPAPSGDPVELLVVTSYGGTDDNRQNFEDAYMAFESATGHTVLNDSSTSDEAWKAKVMTDFQTGSEPDVLFYFAGVDSNSLIENDQVVSIEEIRSVYPDFASNMKDEMLPQSPFDGKQYTVPVNGYWEGLFTNKTVLEAAGVDIPGADYTWDQFLADCETIKNAGFTPIAASLMHVPHYWFEFAVLNNGSVQNHLSLPLNTTDDTVGQKWIAGIEDIKTLYDLGYFPNNTLTAIDDETAQMMLDNEAAFMIDGSWKCSFFEADPDNFTVTYIPGKGDRKATEVIGGLSMGYYITRKAWEDPDTQAAAVALVEALTTDEVVSKFGATQITALKNPAIPQDGLNSLQLDAIAMTAGATYVVAATQDGIDAEARGILVDGVKEVMVGDISSAELLQRSLGIS